MERLSLWRTEWEHAEYGSATIWWTWKPAGRSMLEATPVAVDFDLFTPDSEKDALLALLAEPREKRYLDRGVKGARLG